MSLASGTRLGPYEIGALLGAGGMGEVYKARDTRLDRTVAIKVLPPDIQQHPDRQARFEREAKAISQLTHPHICTLYDIGSASSPQAAGDATVHYLVMEHLDGETLAARLEKGPLPLDETLRIGAEIAGALEAAHRQGIIHRDLKPANIMLTKAGPKLLDFGLAKLRPGGPVAIEATSLPTKQVSATAEGTLLGTVPYMAPEQLEGRDADARTDLWGLGCVLYEMAAGRRAFEGKSHASLIGAIMTAEPPPLPVVQPLASPALEHVVRTCLAKDPDERWQSAADVRRELNWIADQRRLTQTPAGGQPIATPAVAAVTRRRRVRRVLGLVAGAVVLVGASVAVTWLAATRRAPAAGPVHLPIALPATFKLGSSPALNPGVISPDGEQIAFVANDQLCVRALGVADVRCLPGTDGALFPFWAPDSRSVAYFAKRKLWRVDISAGAPRVLCDAPTGRGGSWSRDGVIVAALASTGPLSSISHAGGAPTDVTALDPPRAETGHRWPHFLPDGRHFLYIAFGTRSAVFVGSLDKNEPPRLLLDDTGSASVYAAGHLLFLQGDDLMAQPFDPKRLTRSGAASRLVQNVASDPKHAITSSGYGAAGFSASPVGTLVYRPGGASSVLAVVDRTSGVTTPLVEPGYYLDPALCPRGTRVAFAKRESLDAANDIWILDLANSNRRSRFTSEGGENRAPLWTLDGKAIVFSSSQGGRTALYLKSAVGPGTSELLIEPSHRRYAYSWAPDETLLGIEYESPREDVFAMPFSGERKPRPLIRTSENDADPVVSPDGQWLLYVCDKTGVYEIYITTYPARSGEWPITSGGGVDPAWSRSGKEVFYVHPISGALMSVDVDMGTQPRVGSPKVIHPGYVKWGSYHSFAVLPGEQRFLVNVQDVQTSPITLILNWPALLRR